MADEARAGGVLETDAVADAQLLDADIAQRWEDAADVDEQRSGEPVRQVPAILDGADRGHPIAEAVQRVATQQDPAAELWQLRERDLLARPGHAFSVEPPHQDARAFAEPQEVLQVDSVAPEVVAGIEAMCATDERAREIACRQHLRMIGMARGAPIIPAQLELAVGHADAVEPGQLTRAVHLVDRRPLRAPAVLDLGDRTRRPYVEIADRADIEQAGRANELLAMPDLRGIVEIADAVEPLLRTAIDLSVQLERDPLTEPVAAAHRQPSALAIAPPALGAERQLLARAEQIAVDEPRTQGQAVVAVDLSRRIKPDHAVLGEEQPREPWLDLVALEHQHRSAHGCGDQHDGDARHREQRAPRDAKPRVLIFRIDPPALGPGDRRHVCGGEGSRAQRQGHDGERSHRLPSMQRRCRVATSGYCAASILA